MTVEFITALFYEVDEQLRAIPKHPEAHLWPSEVVTLGLLHALKGGGNRAFYRWLTRDYRPLFPRLPERTRLFRLFTTHQDWTQAFLAAPTVLGVIDTYGIELIHPMREGRSPQQIGRKGLSNHRWIVGGKLCLLLNQWGLIVGWACATANVADNTFQWLIQQVDGRMIVLSDTGFHAAEGDPSNLKLCQRGEWEDRMLVEKPRQKETLLVKPTVSLDVIALVASSCGYYRGHSRATRCAIIHGARGDTERACKTSTMPPSAAHSACCVYAEASLQTSTDDPEEVHRSGTIPRAGTPR